MTLVNSILFANQLLYYRQFYIAIFLQIINNPSMSEWHLMHLYPVGYRHLIIPDELYPPPSLEDTAGIKGSNNS